MASMADLIAAEAKRRAEEEIARRRAELAAKETARLYQVAKTGSSASTPTTKPPAFPKPGSMYTPPIRPPDFSGPAVPQLGATTPMPGSDTLKTQIPAPPKPKYVIPKYMVPSFRPGSQYMRGVGGRRQALAEAETQRLYGISGGTGGTVALPPEMQGEGGPSRLIYAQAGPMPTSQPPSGYQWVVKQFTLANGQNRWSWVIEPVAGRVQAPTETAPAAPTESEYQDYYEEYNDEYDGGGGGYGGGGGGGGGTEVVPPSPLGELSWWATSDTIQPLLRNWATWLQELVEANRLTSPVPNPFVLDAEAEKAYAKLDKERGPVAPGFRSSKEVLSRLQTLLGLDFTGKTDKTQQWQSVINAVPTAGLEAQQLLTSLRFDPNSERWYSVNTPMLTNLKYT